MPKYIIEQSPVYTIIGNQMMKQIPRNFLPVLIKVSKWSLSCIKSQLSPKYFIYAIFNIITSYANKSSK